MRTSPLQDEQPPVRTGDTSAGWQPSDRDDKLPLVNASAALHHDRSALHWPFRDTTQHSEAHRPGQRWQPRY